MQKMGTRIHADQPKCIPLHTCINPMPLLFIKIVAYSKNDSII